MLRFAYFTDKSRTNQGANCTFSENEHLRFARVPVVSIDIPVLPVLSGQKRFIEIVGMAGRVCYDKAIKKHTHTRKIVYLRLGKYDLIAEIF